MKQLVLAALSILLATGVTAADTIQFGAAALTTPDDGWSVSDDDRMLTLGLEAGGAFIEVYNFSKAPAADKTTLATLVGGRAIVVIAFNVPSLAKGHKQDIAAILGSARRGK